MYEKYYGLSHDPFRLLPDAGVCYPHRSNAAAWAYIRYALKRGEGIVVVTGAPGSGKTTLAHKLLQEVDKDKVFAVSLVADDLSPTDLLLKIGYTMGLPVEGKDRAMMTLMIEQHLVEMKDSERRVLLVIDEAQSLSHQALETARRLSDLQSDATSMFQLFLFGQEQLETALTSPSMEQFQHRVIARCQLEPMTAQETKAYLRYRLSAANWKGNPSFNGQAVMAIHHFSGGLPRHVNKICSRLLLHAASEEKNALDENDVKVVVHDLRFEKLGPDRPGAAATQAPPPIPTRKERASIIESKMAAEKTTDDSDIEQTAPPPPQAKVPPKPIPMPHVQTPPMGLRESSRKRSSSHKRQGNKSGKTSSRAVVGFVAVAAIGMLAAVLLLGGIKQGPDAPPAPGATALKKQKLPDPYNSGPTFLTTTGGSGSILPEPAEEQENRVLQQSGYLSAFNGARNDVAADRQNAALAATNQHDTELTLAGLPQPSGLNLTVDNAHSPDTLLRAMTDNSSGTLMGTDELTSPSGKAKSGNTSQ